MLSVNHNVQSCTASRNEDKGSHSRNQSANYLSLHIPYKPAILYPLICERNSQIAKSNGLNIPKISQMSLVKKRKLYNLIFVS